MATPPRMDLHGREDWSGRRVDCRLHGSRRRGVRAAPDVVITTTGDKLVGEIIRVEKDVLTFSTGYSDADFKIEWDKVASIESTRQFLVETFDGKRLSGSLVPNPNTKGAVQVAGTSVPLAQVSAVQPFERKLLVAVRRRAWTSATA